MTARRLLRPLTLRRYHSSLQHGAAPRPLTSVLVANRGEIALRVQKTASLLGIKCTTIYTDPDAHSQHALASPYAINLGDPGAYLDGDRIIEAAKAAGCVGVHPGYGFLSENSNFARRCTEAGLIFIGPPWKAIEEMGDKSQSKNIMSAAGVPCIPGYHGGNQNPDFLKSEADKIGYPVLIKAVKGGGGKGMRIARSAAEFPDQLQSAKTEARNSFGDEVMLVEKYITQPRHIEVQVFADKHGNCVALGERDCSIQRRHQKILEESPAPNLDQSVREDLWAKARTAALAVGYEGAGTVEFIFDNETGQFFFMEMNTRLQVEHPVSEMVTGEDLVRWQLLVAEGKELPLTQDQIRERIAQRGWAIEARIYAENPDMNFIPDAGLLTHLKTPVASPTVRVDAGFVEGDEVTSHYDPMIAKLIVQAESRDSAIQKLLAALEDYEIAGATTNIEFLKRVCVHPAFISGDVETGFIEKYRSALFAKSELEPEVFAQAALGLLLREISSQSGTVGFGAAGTGVGFGSNYQTRKFSLAQMAPDGIKTDAETDVEVGQVGPGTFDVSINDVQYPSVLSHYDLSTRVLTSFYPHTRLATTIVQDGDSLVIFQQGRQYKLRCKPPGWAEKVLGLHDITNSVLAPMPCKVLRVDVKEGDAVVKDQALVVIESMKMETVIRSPHDGVISKVVHKAGDLCKAGTALVEFEDTGKS
ncbi:3-methylcrotonyl-CoA carboxylase subunit alpha [Xylona heveae TC161]|uniref:3-methylcrotonyl-CoA carboxylase subunit alpha n=1 Tax=Xylona heveae (strain CBS 132557 / TC161) TaxID=1328760 RepID=A0A165H5T4_XYLHT|nr:3-methylcrotonyl-CoA carboxylase subunit alpha [Xylona heveae TC161]KZF23026.1 3-methylcrotonyl-CoA carboxylase subunit alpha [Xylona heveae TC161]